MFIYILLLALFGFVQDYTPAISATPVIELVQANHAPVIANLKTSKNIIVPLGECQISCISYDEDGDDLNYKWMCDEGEINGIGYKVVWTAPSNEGIYSINVRISDGEENINETVNVTVRNNHAPTISELLADVEWLKPAESCSIICRAEDSDDDKLSYRWATVDGTISGTGPIIKWTAPQQPGPRNVTVTVSDEYGGSVAKLLTIKVADNHPPIIEEFIITGSEPKYLKEYPDEYKILEGKSCKIECIVANSNDDLKYIWSVARGEISGEGPVITWLPPSVKGLVDLTVKVTDIAGNTAEKTIVFKVETCSCVFV